jgi:hypothetical protein
MFTSAEFRAPVEEKLAQILRAETYRQHANDCRRQADRSCTPAVTERWLKIAEHWFKLAQETENEQHEAA